MPGAPTAARTLSSFFVYHNPPGIPPPPTWMGSPVGDRSPRGRWSNSDRSGVVRRASGKKPEAATGPTRDVLKINCRCIEKSFKRPLKKYQKIVSNRSNIYQKKKSTKHIAHMYRKALEHRSYIHRSSIRKLGNDNRASNEYL